MLRSIDFETMPYLFTDKAGTCQTVEFDGRELDGIYKQVKAMYDLEHPSDGMPIEPMEPGWYMTRDGEDLLSFDVTHGIFTISNAMRHRSLTVIWKRWTGTWSNARSMLTHFL